MGLNYTSKINGSTTLISKHGRKIDKEELIGALVTFELETRIEEYEDR